VAWNAFLDRMFELSIAVCPAISAPSGRPLSLVPAGGSWELRVAMKPLPEFSFTPLPIEERPHDPAGTAQGWSFKTLEQNEDTFPHAIEATDERGRSAIYVPLNWAMDAGDRVSVKATIRKFVTDRASVTIPSSTSHSQLHRKRAPRSATKLRCSAKSPGLMRPSRPWTSMTENTQR
jgi:hypothetical protein